MRESLREVWALLRELELDHHASHYATVFSGERTAYIADLRQEEVEELLEYLKRFNKPAQATAEWPKAQRDYNSRPDVSLP